MSADAAGAIASGALPLAILVALAAGFVSFASPCVLPLVPGFLGYVTGLSGVSLEQRSRGRLMLGALLFILGFTLVFIAVAVTVSTAGTLLKEHQSLLMRLGGVIVILMAVVFLGSDSLGRLGRLGSLSALRPGWRPAAGLAGAPLLGMVFGLGWAPCTGPTFGAIIALSTALSGDQYVMARGVGLATAYSVGLGVPFLLIAGGYSRAGRASRWVRGHYRGVQIAGGGLLLVVGLLLVTGLWEIAVTSMQSRLITQFETVL